MLNMRCSRQIRSIDTISTSSVRLILLCSAAVALLFLLQADLRAEQECGDVMRVELRASEGTTKHEEARLFLWQHWIHKQCGSLFVKAWSREGVKNESQYQLQVIAAKRVMMSVQMSRANDPSAPVDALAVPATGVVQTASPETRSYEVCSVERVKPEVPFVLERAKPIPDNKVVPPSKYLLRFKDKNGKVVADF